MDTFTAAPRTEVEIEALAAALAASRGAAPAWLNAELHGPMSLPPLKADPDAYRWHMKAALSVGALLLAFVCGVDFTAEVKAAPQAVARPVFRVDEDAADALALVQQSTMAGDDVSVFQRLGSVSRHADGRKAWSAEKGEDDTYLVIYREPAGAPAYAFEVDLESGLVQPTPEAVDALALMRVHELETPKELVARAN